MFPFYILHDGMLSSDAVLPVSNLSSSHSLLTQPCSCPGFHSVPLTSQQFSWVGPLLQAPPVRRLLVVQDLVPMSPPQGGPQELCMGLSAALLPYSLAHCSVLYSTYHHLQWSCSLVHVLIFHLLSEESRRRAEVLPFLFTPVSPESSNSPALRRSQ